MIGRIDDFGAHLTKIFSLDEKSQWTVQLIARTPKCELCKRLRGENEQNKQVREAFPNGIPRAVFKEELDHFKENYPGDKWMLGILKEE